MTSEKGDTDMPLNLREIPQEPTPKGKRRIRSSIWGNVNGYVSGKFWITFGQTHDVWVAAQAQAWLDGREDWYDAEPSAEEKGFEA
jgi:hypothetical protein